VVRSNCCCFHLLLLSRLPSTRLIVTFPPPIVSITAIESRSKEVDCCINPAQSPTTSCGKSTSSQTIIARACASAAAVLLTHESNRQQRCQRRQKGMYFWSDLTTNSGGREVELE
jgi:hypothetical protein